MNTHVNKTLENKSKSDGNGFTKIQGDGTSSSEFDDNRQETIAQRKLQEMVNNSPTVMKLSPYQEIADKAYPATQRWPSLQMKAGLPIKGSGVIQRITDKRLNVLVELMWNSGAGAKANYAKDWQAVLDESEKKDWKQLKQAYLNAHPTEAIKKQKSVMETPDYLYEHTTTNISKLYDEKKIDTGRLLNRYKTTDDDETLGQSSVKVSIGNMTKHVIHAHMNQDGTVQAPKTKSGAAHVKKTEGGSKELGRPIEAVPETLHDPLIIEAVKR